MMSKTVYSQWLLSVSFFNPQRFIS